jgi:hypothetical protein
MTPPISGLSTFSSNRVLLISMSTGPWSATSEGISPAQESSQHHAPLAPQECAEDWTSGSGTRADAVC